MFIFYAMSPYVCFPFLRWVKFLVVVLDRLFFIWETNKVVTGSTGGRLSNNCMGICLGRLSIRHLRRVVVL